MLSLSGRSLQRFSSFLQKLHELRTLEEFPHAVVRLLPTLVGSAQTSYNDVDLQRGRIIGLMEPDEQPIEEMALRLQPHLSQHPLIARQGTPGNEVIKISDFLSRGQFHRIALYNEFFRPLQVEDQMSVELSSVPSHVVALTLNRSGRSFSEDDRALLMMAQPHLRQAYDNAAELSRLQGDLKQNRALWEQLEGGVVLMRPNGEIAFCNANAERLLATYFGHHRTERWRMPAFVPDDIKRHFSLQSRLSLTELRLFAPLCVVQGHKTLVVSCKGWAQEALSLLLEEKIRHEPLELFMARGLTRRQSEVLLHLSRGWSNDQIALHLGTSVHTVKRHLETIYQKMNVDGRGVAAHRARQWLCQKPSASD